MNTIDRHSRARTCEALDSESLAAALSAVWEEQRLCVKHRVVSIEGALAALAAHDLDDEGRRQAARSAHVLAGAVAMFGFVRAAEIARRLELELPGAEADRAPELLSLTLQLREEIARPPRLGRSNALAV